MEAKVTVNLNDLLLLLDRSTQCIKPEAEISDVIFRLQRDAIRVMSGLVEAAPPKRGPRTTPKRTSRSKKKEPEQVAPPPAATPAP